MAINLIFTLTGISSLPCGKCWRDTLHVRGVCNTCGTPHTPDVVHVEISGREYHRIQSNKDWERRKAGA